MKATTGDRLIDAMANYLQDKGLAKVGINLFVHRMPAEIKSGLLLINNAGGAMVDPHIPNYRHCRFRLISRASTSTEALGLLNLVTPSLDLQRCVLDNSIEVKQLIRDNDPVVFPSSVGSNVLEASIALTATYALL